MKSGGDKMYVSGPSKIAVRLFTVKYGSARPLLKCLSEAEIFRKKRIVLLYLYYVYPYLGKCGRLLVTQ